MALELLAPDGSALARGDRPNGSQGWEEMVALAPVGGRYRFRIVAASGAEAPGAYRLEELLQRPATEADRTHLKADRLCGEGKELLGQRSASEAAERYRRAHQSFARLGLEQRQAEAAYGLCRAQLALGELQIGAAFCERSAELYGEGGDALLRAVALRWAGLARVRLGQPDRAGPSLRQARDLYEKAGYYAGAALCLSYLGATYHERGDLQRALTHFEEALEANRKDGDLQTEADIRTDLASLLLDLNQPQRALDAYGRALEINRETGAETHAAVALRGIARAEARLGHMGRAEASAREALGLVGTGGAAQARAGLLATLGAVLRARGKLQEALRAYEEALDLARQVESREREAVLLLELGYLHTLSGNPRRGLALCEQALELFTAMGDEKGRASARARSAEALMDLGRLGEAWERIAPALDTVAALRGATERRDLRADYFAFRQDYFQIALHILMRRHRLQPEAGYHLEALAVHERRLARELVEDLAHGAAAQEVGPDPGLLAEERRLEERLRELAGAGPTDEPARRRRLDELLGELAKIRARTGAGNRGSRDEIRGPREALPAAGAGGVLIRRLQQELLDEGSLLLAYALGEPASYLWAVSPTVVAVHELPSRQKIEPLARSLVDKLAERGDWARPHRRALGERLGEQLLSLVSPLLEDHGRVVVIADGALQAVPFAALPLPGGDGEERYLIGEHEIVNLPSISTLEAIRRAEAQRPARPRGVAAFADPVFEAADPRLRRKAEGAAEPAPEIQVARKELERSARSVGSDPFRRLEESRREAQAVLELAAPGENLLRSGFSATREAATAPQLASYRVLHFATHALAHPDHPELSGLVLSLVDPEGRPREGFLRAFEISRLHLPADLVVLSACETGLGENLAGEGMQGLNRAFFQAGAARVVASLWRVSDARTAELMADFYRAYLRHGLAPAAALRRAQRAMLAKPETSAPYYWAGFLFYGDWRRPGPGQARTMEGRDP